MSNGRKKSRYASDGLRSKVFKTQTQTDRKGLFLYFCNALDILLARDNSSVYVPVCGHKFHRGIVDDLDICRTRRCNQLREIKPTRDPYCASLYRVYTRRNKS